MANNYDGVRKSNLSMEGKIKRWDEALPLGNGKFGALIWGDGSTIRISLDRADLWDKRTAKQIDSEDFRYEELIKLVKNDKYDLIKEKFDDFYSEPTPSKIPAGGLELNYGMPCEDMESALHLLEAQAEVTIKFGNSESHICSFINAKDSYGFIQITGTAKFPELKLICHDFGGNKSNIDSKVMEDGHYSGSLKQLQYPTPVFGDEGNLSWFVQKTQMSLEFAVVTAKSISSLGVLNIAYVIASNTDGEDWLETAKSKVAQVVDTGYENAIKDHREWWHLFWSKIYGEFRLSL